jgi:hypothetical protein
MRIEFFFENRIMKLVRVLNRKDIFKNIFHNSTMVASNKNTILFYLQMKR